MKVCHYAWAQLGLYMSWYLASTTPLRLGLNRLRSNSKSSSIHQDFIFSRTRRYCVGTEIRQLPQPGSSNRVDSDTSWQTNPSENIEPFELEKYSVRPQLITFDAFATLIEPSQSIGRWYREALNSVCDMKIRLPRPLMFAESFKTAYSDMSESHPCFGANDGMTARDWWMQVVARTYQNTKDLCEIGPDELEELLPEVFEMLFDSVFSTKEGWQLKEDVVYTLTKLIEWRDQGSGPKIGIISNFDDRLHTILEELNIADYFDFVLTSYECKSEKPDRAIFDAALARAALPPSAATTAFHVGNSIDTDVEGAVRAGWSAMRFNEWFDDDFPDWRVIETEEEADAGAENRRAILGWGRRALDRPLNPAAAVSTDTADDATTDASENTSAAAAVKYLEWAELWGLDDVLTLFGFPEDLEKPIRTTVIRGFLEDK